MSFKVDRMAFKILVLDDSKQEITIIKPPISQIWALKPKMEKLYIYIYTPKSKKKEKKKKKQNPFPNLWGLLWDLS